MRQLALIFTTLCFTACALMTNGTRQRVSLAAANGDSVIATIGGKKVQLPAENVSLSRRGEVIHIYNADNPKYMDSSVNSYALNGPQNMGITPGTYFDLFGILLFFLPGLIASYIDKGTGAQLKYIDSNLTVPVYFKK